MRLFGYGTRWALLELWRRRGRFLGVTATLAALCTLAVILVSLAAGLWSGATGAIGGSSADLLVFSSDSLNSFAHSQVSLADIPVAARIPGVAAVGAIGTLTTTMRLPDGTQQLSVIGMQPGRPGSAPTPVAGRLPQDGENAVAVDVSLRSDGVKLGDTLRASAGGPEMRVVGFVPDERYELLPVVWTTLGTWQVLSAAAEPETRSPVPTAQVLTIGLAAGADSRRTAAALARALDASVITRGQAMLAIPGASAMRSTLNELIAAVLIVALLATALFAALHTTERHSELARLRALGASARALAAGLLAQVEIPVILAAIIAYLLTIALIAVVPPAFPVALPVLRAVGLAALILVAGIVGALGSMIRVIRIDPVITLENT
jgi:putative ABC transport system permease protein